MLAVNVESMYSERDAALCDLERAGPEAGVKIDTDGNVLIEFMDSSQLPFTFHTVDSVVWTLLSRSSVNFGTQQYQVRN